MSSIRQRLREYTIRKPDLGLVQDLTEEGVDHRAFISGNNFRIRPGRVEKAPGWQAFGSTNLVDVVRHMAVAAFQSGVSILLAATRLRVFRYNTTTDQFDDIAGSDMSGVQNAPYSSDIYKDTWIFSNRGDRVKKWTGSGNIADLGGLDDAEPGSVDVESAKVVAAAGPFLLLGATTEDGTSYPLRVRWNMFDTLETWKNDADGNGQAGYLDIAEGSDYVVNIVPIGNYWAVYKERSIHLLTYVGVPVVWARRQVVVGRGLLSPKSVISLGDFHICLLQDNFYVFNGTGLQRIGDHIREYFFNSLNPLKKDLVFALHIEDKAEVVFAYPGLSSDYPDKAVVYNYITNSWAFRDFPFTSGAEFLTQESTTWSDLVGTWASQSWSWDNRVFTESAPTIIVGDEGGDIHQYDITNAKHGEDIDGYVQTALTDFGYADRIKRAFRLKPVCEKTSVSLEVTIITADKPRGDTTEHGPYTLDMSADSPFVDFDHFGRYFAVKFRTREKDQYFRISGWTWQYSIGESR